jgi:hypothetical protein
MEAKFFGVSYIWWGALCLGISAVFVQLWPSAKITKATPFLQAMILRWGHAAVWGLLALACFLRALLNNSGPGQIAALLALIIYLTFMFTLLRG